MVVVLFAGLLGKSLPGGFVPDEDQGYFIMNVALPASSSLQRTDQVCTQVETILSKYESLEFVTSIVGFSHYYRCLSVKRCNIFCNGKRMEGQGPDCRADND